MINYDELNRDRLISLYIQAKESLRALAALCDKNYIEPTETNIFSGNPSDMYEAGIMTGLQTAGEEALEWLESLEEKEKESYK